MRTPLLLLALCLLTGCMTVEPSGMTGARDSSGERAIATEPLVGHVVFPTLQAQATTSDLASGSTVAVLDASTSETVASTLTDSSGAFRMVFYTFHPDPSATYVLEASKGLGGNQPGHPTVRLRTFTRYVLNQGWVSITNTTPNVGVVINASTTALAIGSALLSLRTTIDPSQLIGKVSVPSTYTPVSFLSTGDHTTLRTLVTEVLAGDGDPVACVGIRPNGDWLRLDLPLAVTGVSPSSARAGDLVTLSGTGFQEATSSHVVTFNGVTSWVASSSPTQLVVRVPAGATSGAVRVMVGGREVVWPAFEVTVSLGGDVAPEF